MAKLSKVRRLFSLKTSTFFIQDHFKWNFFCKFAQYFQKVHKIVIIFSASIQTWLKWFLLSSFTKNNCLGFIRSISTSSHVRSVLIGNEYQKCCLKLWIFIYFLIFYLDKLNQCWDINERSQPTKSFLLCETFIEN